MVELTDLVFALDSIPAIFGVTRDPFIVYTSNVCAMLGLRSLYFLLAGAVKNLVYLHFGLACVLIFIGAKMLGEHFFPFPPFLARHRGRHPRRLGCGFAAETQRLG